MAMDVGGSKKGVKSDINITPLVDVVLVLLIIFMVVTPLAQRGYDLEVPREEVNPIPPNPEDPAKQVILSINEEECNGLGSPLTQPGLPPGCTVRLNRRVLEDPRSARSGAIRQRTRGCGLGSCCPLSVAGLARVFALRRRADSHPAYPTPTPGLCRTLQQLVSAPLIATTLFAAGYPETRTATPTDTVNTQHPQRRLQGLTPAQHRRRCQLHKLPHDYVSPTALLPVAAGRISFIRQVTLNGKVHLLSQTFKVGKRLTGEYVKVVLDTRRGYLTVYRQGRFFKRWPYPFVKN